MTKSENRDLSSTLENKATKQGHYVASESAQGASVSLRGGHAEVAIALDVFHRRPGKRGRGLSNFYVHREVVA